MWLQLRQQHGVKNIHESPIITQKNCIEDEHKLFCVKGYGYYKDNVQSETLSLIQFRVDLFICMEKTMENSDGDDT